MFSKNLKILFSNRVKTKIQSLFPLHVCRKFWKRRPSLNNLNNLSKCFLRVSVEMEKGEGPVAEIVKSALLYLFVGVSYSNSHSGPFSSPPAPVWGSVWLSCYFRSFVCGSPYPVSCSWLRVCVWVSVRVGVTFTLNTECVKHKYEALHIPLPFLFPVPSLR